MVRIDTSRARARTWVFIAAFVAAGIVFGIFGANRPRLDDPPRSHRMAMTSGLLADPMRRPPLAG